MGKQASSTFYTYDYYLTNSFYMGTSVFMSNIMFQFPTLVSEIQFNQPIYDFFLSIGMSHNITRFLIVVCSMASMYCTFGLIKCIENDDKEFCDLKHEEGKLEPPQQLKSPKSIETRH